MSGNYKPYSNVNFVTEKGKVLPMRKVLNEALYVVQSLVK